MTQVSRVPPVPTGPPVPPGDAVSGRRSRRGTVAVVVLVLLAAAIVTVRSFVAVPVRIASDSMTPTLAPGDVVLVSRSAPDLDELHRFDLVAFAEPRTGQRTVKRVVGLPGEDVVVLDGVLHVDGRPVDEPWIAHETVDGTFSRTFHVPQTGILVFGDNRMNSLDSRDYGAVDAEALEGRVLVRLWPW